jgi:hypothetical protein
MMHGGGKGRVGGATTSRRTPPAANGGRSATVRCEAWAWRSRARTMINEHANIAIDDATYGSLYIYIYIYVVVYI